MTVFICFLTYLSIKDDLNFGQRSEPGEFLLDFPLRGVKTQSEYADAVVDWRSIPVAEMTTTVRHRGTAEKKHHKIPFLSNFPSCWLTCAICPWKGVLDTLTWASMTSTLTWSIAWSTWGCANEIWSNGLGTTSKTKKKGQNYKILLNQEN